MFGICCPNVWAMVLGIPLRSFHKAFHPLNSVRHLHSYKFFPRSYEARHVTSIFFFCSVLWSSCIPIPPQPPHTSLTLPAAFPQGRVPHLPPVRVAAPTQIKHHGLKTPVLSSLYTILSQALGFCSGLGLLLTLLLGSPDIAFFLSL